MRRARLGVLEQGGPLQVRATRKLLGFTNGPPAVLAYRPEFRRELLASLAGCGWRRVEWERTRVERRNTEPKS